MELTIDSRPCDLGEGALAVPGYDAAKCADIDACREGRSLRLTIPPTARNDALMAFARDPHAAVRFNAAVHTAELTADGATLLRGTVRLLAASEAGYTLEIRSRGAGWAQQAARRMLNTLGVEYEAELTPLTIFRSWTDSSPVKFFPIHRDAYPERNDSEDLLPAERLLSVDDYHPFLHLATLLETLFREAEYRIESRFLRSEFFRSLYISGAYATRDTTAIQARMGFFARRLGAVTAVADQAGRVYADPATTENSVGNLVETATPQAVDADGEPIPELCNHGNCFRIEQGRILFRPPTEVNAGFEYYLRYTTDHCILSRTRLEGFDTLYLGPGGEMPFSLANRYADRREELAPNRSYLAIVFDHREGAQYRLTCTLDGAAGSLWTAFAARTAQVASPAGGSVSDPVLQVAGSGGWADYAGDWALYDGYIGETGRTTVELRVRTPAETVSADNPKTFHSIYFAGAGPGMRLTLHKECSLRPRFLPGPGFGSRIVFADVARHRVRQSELLEAAAHLFNLRFYTEEATRTVLIEPADDFAGAGAAADWREKSDLSQPALLVDTAAEVHELRTWGYQEGDGAVRRFEARNDCRLGAWSHRTDSSAARLGEKTLLNPLFAPTLSAAGHYANAPSARIMQVGDRDAAEEEGAGFTPRIVRYRGMHPLPRGERWGYPSDGSEYPLAAFHFDGDAHAEPFTLCFEDRDGARGLHRFYDRQVRQEESRGRIELALRLAPHEFEALLAPGTGAPDIRSAFCIDTGAGCVRAALRTVGDYDPEAASVRCTFDRACED